MSLIYSAFNDQLVSDLHGIYLKHHKKNLNEHNKNSFINKVIGKNFLFGKILLTVFNVQRVLADHKIERMTIHFKTGQFRLAFFVVSNAQILYGTKMEFYI